MTGLLDRQEQWLKSELGTNVDFLDLQPRYDRLGSIRDVAIEVLRERRADLLNSPLSVNVTGVVSVNYGSNVDQLTKRIDALTQLPDDPSLPGNTDVDGDDGSETIGFVQLGRTRGR